MQQYKRQFTGFILCFCLLGAAIPAQAASITDMADSLQRIQQSLIELQAKLAQSGQGQVLGATTITVTSDKELFDAIRSLRGGETIELAPGTYNKIYINAGRYTKMSVGEHSVSGEAPKPTSEVVITSQDPNNPATLTSLDFRGVQNITLDNLMFDYEFTGGETWINRFEISGSNNMKILNSTFDGDIARNTGDPARDGFATGYGLSLGGSSQIVLENNVFYSWMRAGVFSGMNDFTVKNNEIYDMRSDGFNFIRVQDTLIEGNYFHDFRISPQSKDHRDMIQFWTNGTSKPSVDVTIRGNWLLTQDGNTTQSIFMRNEEVDNGRAGEEMFYRNFLIEDNVIHNGHLHGISIGEVDGVVIRNNTLLRNRATKDFRSVTVPRISVASDSKNVTITKNIYPILNAGDSAIDKNDNLRIQSYDQTSPGYYTKYFINPLAGADVRKDDLTIIPGSLADTGNYGSSLLQPPRDLVYIQHTAGTGLNTLAYRFDVGGNAPNAQWNFGDGNTAQGQSVTHTYDKGGTYMVTLTAGGETIEKTIMAESPIVLNVNFNDGTANDNSFLDLEAKVSRSLTFADGVVSYKGGTREVIEYPERSEFINNDEYSLLFDLRVDKENNASGWNLIYFLSSFVIGANSNTINLNGVSNVSHRFETGTWYQIALIFDGEARTKTLYIDGQKVAEKTGVGSNQGGSTHHSLTLGGPFTTSFPHSLDNVFFLRGALSPEQLTTYVAEGTLPISSGFVPAIEKEPQPEQEQEQEEEEEKNIICQTNYNQSENSDISNECDEPQNTSPVASDDYLTTIADRPTTIDVLKNDSDADGDTLTTTRFTNKRGSNGGSFSLTKDGELTFDPRNDFDGLATSETETTVSYTISDGSETDTATVNVVVTVAKENDLRLENPDRPVDLGTTRLRINANLNVRTTPEGEVIAVMQQGSQAIKLNDSVVAQGEYNWIKVRFDSGVEGYIAEQYTNSVTTSQNLTSEQLSAIMQQILILLQQIQTLQERLAELEAEQ